MTKCSSLLSDGNHFWYCRCPDMQEKWKKLSQEFSDGFKSLTASQLGCVIPGSEVKADNNITFIN